MHWRPNINLSKTSSRLLLTFVLSGALLLPKQGQSIGLMFSYFYPKNGYIASPLVPVSIKDLGFRLGVVGLNSSLSVYSIGGMPVSGLEDLDIKDPVIGPVHSAVATVTPQIIIPVNKFEFRLSGGLFSFYNFNSDLLYGNIDRAIAQKEKWDAVTSDFEYENNLGFGWTGGFSITYMIIEGVLGVTAGANYYRGSSELNLKGSYVGGKEGSNLVRKTVNYPDSKIDYEGLEVMIGISIFSGQGSDDEGKEK